jgi:hypothetical protein
MSSSAGAGLFRADSSKLTHQYLIAGLRLATDQQLAGMGGFATEPAKQTSLPTFDPIDWQVAHQTFSGQAVLARATWPVICRAASQAYLIEIEGLCDLEVHRHGRVRMLNAAPGADQLDLALTLISPGWVLSWPDRGVWLLHGSGVVTTGSRSIALVGSSGQGKSTLASAFGEHRFADDCMAVEASTARLTGPFPQPKLADCGAASLPVDRLNHVVELSPSNNAGSVELVPLSDAEAVTSLARHTVAAALLASDDLARHLADCRRLAERVQCWRLSFRQVPDQIPAMVKALNTL